MANDNIVLLRHLKQSALRCAAMVTSKISELTTAISEDLAELDDTKQNKLTFDTTPTEGSTNPVTSDGVAKCMTAVVGDVNSVIEGILDGANLAEVNELLDEINGEVVE